MTSVFVSHSSSDYDLVDELIIKPLQEQGVEVWYSRDSIHGAEEWEKRIRQALRNCEWFLVALSAHSVQSEWVRAEVDWALEHRQGRILPALIGDCDPEDCNLRLRTLQHIDLRGNNPRGRAALSQIWNAQASTALPAPAHQQPSRRRPFALLAIVAGIALATALCLWLLLRPRLPPDDHRAANTVERSPPPATSAAVVASSSSSPPPLASASPTALPAVVTPPPAISSGEAKAVPAPPSPTVTAPARGDLIGIWTNDVANMNFRTTFRKDGTMTSTWIDTNTNRIVFQGTGSYIFNGKRVTYIFPPNSQEGELTWIDADHANYLTLKSPVPGAVGVLTLMTRVK